MDRRTRQHLIAEKFARAFGSSPTLWVQAPGRVDLMGSHTDYNQGYVLTMTIDRDTWIAARPRTDRQLALYSLNVEGCAMFNLDNIQPMRTDLWANYVGGVAKVLQAEGFPLRGFDGVLHSTVPFSSGLSSSAALEVATAVLFKALSDLDIDPVTMALLCQRAENEFVGVKCGILDQYTSAMGQAGHAVILDCRTLTSEVAAIPDDVQVVICDTQSKRQLIGSEYADRRAQCESGAALLAQFFPGVTALRDVTLEQFETRRADLPNMVAKRCRFIIEENARVLALAQALSARDLTAIGALTAESYSGAHNLYEICSPPMDVMIDSMRSAPGVIGARQAGAGFGGCMVAFVEKADVPAFETVIRKTYSMRTGTKPKVYPVHAAPGAGLLHG